MFIEALYIKCANFASYSTETMYHCIHVNLNWILDAIAFKSINSYL